MCRGHHVGNLVVLEATADQHRPGGAASSVRVSLGRIGEERGEDRERLIRRRGLWPPPMLALETASAGGDRTRGPQSSAPQCVDQAPQPLLKGPEADEQDSRSGRAGG